MAVSSRLSPRERQIMEVLFTSGAATVGEVRQRMADPPSENAVRTFLTILEDKGHVRRRKDGRSYRWSPIARRERAGRDDLGRVLRTFFSGSLTEAFTAYLTDSKTRPSDDDLERLHQAIEQTRQKES